MRLVSARRSAAGRLAPIGVLLLAGASLVPACARTAGIDSVTMALDADGTRKRDVFFTDTKEIHCVVEAGVGRPGVTIEVVIRQLQRYDFTQRRFVDADRVAAQAEQTPAAGEQPQKVDFILTRGDPGTNDTTGPYPAGRYVCEARLDGELQGSATFNVQFPDCPTAIITPGSRCFGFYEDGKQCPFYGASSTEKASCTCTIDKGWDTCG